MTLPDHYYAQGAEVIKQLEGIIGRPAVRQGLRTLLSDHAHRDATKADLVRHWARASGQNLDEWAVGTLVSVPEDERGSPR